ncbi:hypothetical protein GW756_05270 [bacterium]|nr:hypothetical protein [bacterium]NCQ55361.1 hypothetical protein [Candidatus Parcubacteria bacterium]NCS96752.1 hypothetical protein [bacterium]
MKTKVEGISIFISMGTSLLVLSLAFATLTSIGRSIDQASNIQRSTQLFFASESGAEAAFFHHNSRGSGVNFTGTHSSQRIAHPSINASTNWTIEGRTDKVDNAINNDAIFVDILKEGQTYKIPFKWDISTNPSQQAPQVSAARYDEPNFINDEFELTFFQTPEDIPTSDALTDFEERYGFQTGVFDPLKGSFDFGDSSADPEVLIDWSLTRKNNVQGVQTFIPTNNEECSGFLGNEGYICENDLLSISSGGIVIRANAAIPGSVLPGAKPDSLDYFWTCFAAGGPNPPVRIGETCSDYQLTIRPLLKLSDTVTGNKVPGIPFQLKLDVDGSTPTHFPLNTYTVVSDVNQEDFSQRIEIEVPERTSIGAFDYVIFD